MNGLQLLDQIRIPTDALGVATDGVLTVGGYRADELVQRYGSPLYVTIEETIRENYRAISTAFNQSWPVGVDIFYAIKTNNTLAIRAILNEEGAGGECFGAVEFLATLNSGISPEKMILNGSDKSPSELETAANSGAVINIDHADEVEILAALGQPDRPVRVNLRLKLFSEAFDVFSGEFFKTGGTVSDALCQAKWGYSIPAAIELVRKIRACPTLSLLGFSSHVGRFSNDPEAFAVTARELARATKQIFLETDFWPAVLDLGGGWPRQREPESRQPDLNPFVIGDYAQAVSAALLDEFEGRVLPRLWLEPGRYIVGNAVILLATVGAVKADLGQTWVHVDASTNQLMRIETSRSWYYILPASRMAAEMDHKVDIVGPSCIPSLLGSQRDMPDLMRGDLIAIPDAGMYAEVISNQFNGLVRPANILVSKHGADIVRRRETFEDIFGMHAVPARLLGPGIGDAS